MPKADATELAPKKSAIEPSGTLFAACRRVSALWSSAVQRSI